MKIFPSIASADLLNLQQAILCLEEAKVDGIHVDIEDGNFVPVMRLGTEIIKSIRSVTKLHIDVHLMVSNPGDLIPIVIGNGADSVSFHWETCEYPRSMLGKIKSYGKRAGIALNPKTGLPDLKPYLDLIDFVLVLTTEPDQIGESFLPSVLMKTKVGKRIYLENDLEWIVDGGININNIQLLNQLGIDSAVIGRGVFENNTVQKNVKQMRLLTDIQKK